MANRKNRFVFFVKLSVSLSLLIYLIWLIDWERAVRILRGTDKLSLCVVPFVSLTGFWFASLRWRLILADNNVNFSIRNAYRGYLLGLFYGHFLPGVLGGDVVRIGLCAQQTKCGVSIATASVLLERISGITALFLMAFLVYLFFPSIASSLLAIEDSRLIALIAIGGILTLVVAVMGRRLCMRWLPKENARGVWSFVRTAMLAVATLKGRTLGSVLMFSAMFQASDIVATFLLARAMNMDLPLTVFFAVVPLVYLATVFPISLGGLGVREGTLVFFLSQFGVMTSDAVILSFLIYLNRLLIGGTGGGFHLIETLAVKFSRTGRTESVGRNSSFS